MSSNKLKSIAKILKRKLLPFQKIELQNSNNVSKFNLGKNYYLDDERSKKALSDTISPVLIKRNNIKDFVKQVRLENQKGKLTDPYLINLMHGFASSEKDRKKLFSDLFKSITIMHKDKVKENNRDTVSSIGNLLKNIEKTGLNVSTIIDVGFARGTPELEVAFNKAKYFAIDPAPDNAQWISNFCNDRNNAVGLNVAISNRKGKSKLKVPHSATNSSLVDFDEKISPDDTLVEVELITLEELAKDYDLGEKWVILKVDTEGNDYKVFQGSKKILSKIGLIITELRIDDPDHPNSFKNVSSMLEHHNFNFYRMYNPNYNIRGVFRQADFVFFNKKFNDEYLDKTSAVDLRKETINQLVRENKALSKKNAQSLANQTIQR